MSAADAKERRRLTLEKALEEIRGIDPREKARLGGFSCESRGNGYRLIIPTLVSAIAIDLPEGEISVPPALESFSLRVLSLRYVKLANGVPVSGEWIAYRELPGGRFYAATLSPTVERPLARTFGRDRGTLEQAARELGGRPASFGDESYAFLPFPRTPLLVVLHWGDEEFEPECRLLFDRCCSSYLNTDDLKILATQLAAYLLRAGGVAVEDENLLWMVD